MEENEQDDNNTCVKCNEVCNGDFYRCDSCLKKVHKECSNLTSSEVRCMPLQKRILLFICEDCKKYIARMPYMMKLMETMMKDIEFLKTGLKKENYADILKQKPVVRPNVTNTTFPTLIIKPRVVQNMEVSRKEIQTSINPSKINIGIRNFNETKKGSIILKCDTEQEIKILKEEAERKLKGKYEIEIPKKVLPKIKITNYSGDKSINVLEETLKKQNVWIDNTDHLKITFVRKFNNKPYSTIYAECSGNLFTKMLAYGKVCIDWERLPVYEDLAVTRCFQCQGYLHKSTNCTKTQICGHCAGNHPTSECDSEIKKCINCVTANKYYKTKYGTDHSALDKNCPSLKYHVGVIKNRRDYTAYQDG